MNKTVNQFNECLQDAVRQFAASVKELNNAVYDEKSIEPSKQDCLVRSNDYLNLLDVFIPVNKLANTIITELIGHALDDAIIPAYSPVTRKLSFKITNNIITGITKLLVGWELHDYLSEAHYYYNYDNAGKEISRYFTGKSFQIVDVRL